MVSIVQATKADLKCIYNVETEAFGSHGYPAFFIRQAFDCWANGLLVAKNEDQIFGYVLQVPSSNHQGDAWVLSLAVSKQAQGKGLGKKLLETAIKNAKGYKRLLLTVCPKNTGAYALYQSYGFYLVEEEQDYFDIGEHRLVLALDIAE
ncbi:MULTISPECIES: GNAT family N-acetyltransferase [unclassified Aliivibrio]|uniref:GNAT family N-acetyltransferase n=1 Tax=unclassified Aliivibrio TaxID=2645654 RepID=UPI00080DEC22|nr:MULTISPECIES: N-acetyltransferase [unclassified Aliivibrio]OCH18963.1 alanine acetyltransferase [Aliivibrio sp. 1S165]OCH19840.1 alanine acetyltransferase [Aliivibrio sp. 1S128]OCH30842.1 alanine acetyltransferase [Aliivibrio sp. 1S175]